MIYKHSDVIGLERVFDLDFAVQCANTSYIAPVFSTLSKIFTFIDKPIGHLSYGNCLANPNNTDYPFELLVPLVLEIYGIYGTIFLLPILSVILIFIYAQFYVLGLIGSLFKIQMTATGAQVFFSYTILGILWGGKYFNYLMSDYLSIVALLFTLGILKSLFLIARICSESRSTNSA